MKCPCISLCLTRLLVVLLGLVGLLQTQQVRAQFPPHPQQDYKPASDEFDGIAKAVADSLKTRAAGNFATNFSVAPKDWRSVITTNLSKDEEDRINTFAKGAGYNLQRLNSDVAAILARADSLHLDFSGSPMAYQVIMPKHVGNIYLGNPANTKLTLPYVESLEIFLFRDDAPDRSTNNAFKITIRGLEKFPAGWRISDGIQWSGFPTNVADAKMLRELALAGKISARQPVTSEDDPAVLKLAESLIRFIRTGDTNVFQKDLLVNSDEVWAVFEKSGRKGPTRQELDEEIIRWGQEQMAAALKILKLMDTAGIDLKNADVQIKAATMEHCQSQGDPGTVDQLIGSQFKLSMTVKADAKAKSGTSLSGDYVLAVTELMKLGGGWKVAKDVHWEKLPDGVVDSQIAAAMEFENYVAEHRALPAGTPAPEIEFTTLAGEKKMKLSDLRGKVVVVDFWSTWCGPCQEPMAELQKIRDTHPGWQDKVVIVPVSIDDSMGIVRKHVDQRGWTNTFNVWAGEGGWHSATAKAFRVTGVPTSYVIDTQGRILWSGHPDANTISRTIDYLLKK